MRNARYDGKDELNQGREYTPEQIAGEDGRGGVLLLCQLKPNNPQMISRVLPFVNAGYSTWAFVIAQVKAPYDWYGDGEIVRMVVEDLAGNPNHPGWAKVLLLLLMDDQFRSYSAWTSQNAWLYDEAHRVGGYDASIEWAKPDTVTMIEIDETRPVPTLALLLDEGGRPAPG